MLWSRICHWLTETPQNVCVFVWVKHQFSIRIDLIRWTAAGMSEWFWRKLIHSWIVDSGELKGWFWSRVYATQRPIRHSTQSWTFMVLRGVLASGPITALAAASPQQKVTISGRSTSGPHGGRKEGPQGRKGSVRPWGWVNAGPESDL